MMMAVMSIKGLVNHWKQFRVSYHLEEMWVICGWKMLPDNFKTRTLHEELLLILWQDRRLTSFLSGFLVKDDLFKWLTIWSEPCFSFLHCWLFLLFLLWLLWFTIWCKNFVLIHNLVFMTLDFRKRYNRKFVILKEKITWQVK